MFNEKVCFAKPICSLSEEFYMESMLNCSLIWIEEEKLGSKPDFNHLVKF